MRTTERVAAVEEAALGERVVTAAELAGDLLVGRAAPRHEDDVEAGEAEDGDDEEGDDADGYDANEDGRLGQGVPLVEDVHEAHDEDGGHVGREGEQEHEEVAVVSPPDAVVHPRTMVVEDLR